MTSRTRWLLLWVVTLGVPAWASDPSEPRFGLGVGVGWIASGGSGLPLGFDGARLPVELVGAYRFSQRTAASFGVGTPVAGEGFTAWLGAELSLPIVEGRDVRWRVYGTPGLQFGFVGPGYYALRSNVFVGYEYIYQGPLTPGVRLPLGTAVTFAHGHVEPFLEFLPVLEFLPSPTFGVGAGLGVRFYF